MFKVRVCGVSVIKNKSVLNICQKNARNLELLLFGTTNSPVLGILIVLGLNLNLIKDLITKGLFLIYYPCQ